MTGCWSQGKGEESGFYLERYWVDADDGVRGGVEKEMRSEFNFEVRGR